MNLSVTLFGPVAGAFHAMAPVVFVLFTLVVFDVLFSVKVKVPPVAVTATLRTALWVASPRVNTVAGTAEAIGGGGSGDR